MHRERDIRSTRGGLKKKNTEDLVIKKGVSEMKKDIIGIILSLGIAGMKV